MTEGIPVRRPGFKRVPFEDGDPKEILGMAIFKNTNLIVATSNGVYEYDETRETFIKVQ